MNLTVAAGEIVALVGLNGAGKTTLLKLATGMLRPDRGRVLIGGVDISAMTSENWKGVGHFIDGPALYAELTVRQNLHLAALMRGTAPSAVDSTLTALGLERLADRRARQLSLGNRQRVGIAAALQHSPVLLILDEPANSLDPAGVLLLRDLLLERKDAGGGVLISSHHLDEVARLADRILVMNRGCLIGDLEPGGRDLERALFERLRLDDLSRVAR
ncbi:ABC transporter ATP-binding protein [Microbacterium sulfonylureivorans]|uniref:ABC transporter ATP-binding protein n=1 Tax=Microbacterium sulfonylureivorans TaxID=2486854 RepID=UPI001F0C0588|nr:ABC transporter ATP-binding protein [Microbacterium sulfonylureivorans]